MSDKLKDLREKQEKLLADARAKLDEIDGTDESREAEITVEYDAIMAEYDKTETEAKREEDLSARTAKLEASQAALEEVDRRKRPGGGEKTARTEPEGTDDVQKRRELERSAFCNYLRYGMEGLNTEERNTLASRRNEMRDLLGEAEARAQGVLTAGAGGALVPEGFMDELVKSLAAFGPMNDGSVVRVLTTATGNTMPWPTVDDTANEGALIAENTQVTALDVTFGVKQLDAYKYTSRLILVSNELLQDSAINVEQTISDLMAERIGRIANRHLTTGTGSGQPNGVVTASTLGVTAASASTLTADELIDLEHSVDPAYRSDPSVRFMFNDTTFKVIRKLKDGQSNYLWQPADLRIGAPASFLGYPYSVNQAMDSFGTQSPTADNRPVIFGAMNRYVVRFVRSFAVRRLNERYADYDQIGFLGFTRLDGELIDTAAVKHLVSPQA